MRRWTQSLAAMAAGVALVAAACGGDNGGSTATTAAPTGRTSIAIGETLAPKSLDITQESGAAIPQALLYNVYETLVKIDDSGAFQPLLAKSYRVSDDKRTYTFTLQDGVQFANGDPMTATEVVSTYTFNKGNAKAPPLISGTFAVVDSITSPDAKTVVIKLKQPSRDFLFNLAQTAGVVIDPKTRADVATKTNGSGPYAVTNFVTNATLELKRRDTYWGTKPGVGQVTFKYFADANALANAIKTGGVDIVDNITPELFGQFQSDTAKFETVNGKSSGEVILAMNNSRKPLDDVRVRQAITYAINKKDVNDIAEQGLGQIIGSHSSPNDPWFVDLSNTYPYDTQKAKDLLAAAGVSKLSLTLDVIPTPYAQASAPVIKDALAKVGITVKLNPEEFPLWLDKDFGKADFDLTIVAHVEARDTNLYANPKYYWRYDSPKVQDLLKRADAAPSEQESNQLYGEALRQINADAVNDWLYLLPRLEVVKKGITGYPKGSSTLSYDVTGIK
jgi:peptide/nickel transport system substrate-binding protein